MLKHAKSVGLVIALILSISTVLPARDRFGALNSKQYGYNFGYKDGYQFGRDSGAQAARYDFRSEDFRYADRGYDRSMGEQDDFQQGYRNGYKAGYDDGYYGRPGRFNYNYDSYPANHRDVRYGRHEDDDDLYGNRGYGNQNIARDFGYRDGVAQGEKDRNKGKEYRPRKNDAFEDADHGYHKEFGKKDFYKEQYRQAFIRGYQEGYNRY